MAGSKKKDASVKPDMTSVKAEIERQRQFVTCGADENKHVNEHAFSGAYAAVGLDNTFSMESFRESFGVEVTKLDAEKVEFEMRGISPAIANAFRRILIAEVPTMAIEKVFVVNNTSVIQDEVFAHRLGLVPIRADPRAFEYRADSDLPTERNTIVFKMHVRCHREKGGDGSVPGALVNELVYTDALKWAPAGSELPPEEETKFTSFAQAQGEYLARAAAEAKESRPDAGPGAGDPASVSTVHDDILLAKMVAGQEIELEAHCVKGLGKDHAKFSPVGTAWYRMVPKVEFLAPIVGEDADVFVRQCDAPIENHKCYGVSGSGAKRSVVVRNERGCDLCVERVRELSGEPGWGDKIALRKKKDHFIFTVESTGQLPPDVLVKEAIKVLASKCQSVLSTL
jgi:DNA-directed RNA polymerase I and III subunit RPAC1